MLLEIVKNTKGTTTVQSMFKNKSPSGLIDELKSLKYTPDKHPNVIDIIKIFHKPPFNKLYLFS